MPEAGPSSTPSLSLRPSNVVTIFLARFHVRHGNQIEFQHPPAPNTASSSGSETLVDVDEPQDAPGVDLSGVEWKVLPSGGHLIDSDVIYFSTPTQDTTGVACFRNIKLNDDAQRGARMVSIGLVLKCDSADDRNRQLPSGLAQQLAIVPHLSNLEKLADKLAHDPQDTALLKQYYEQHKVRPGGTSTGLDGKRMAQLRMRRRRDPKNLPHDPISHMPALCGCLGALLPHLVKTLMLPHHRLLIFSPAPPLVHAAHVGYNIAELISLAIVRSVKRHESLESLLHQATVQVRGQIGVHDITALEDEEKRRRSKAGGREQTWIAWSTDKILLEKPYLFDSVLDLSALITRESKGVLDESVMESSAASAKLLKVVRPSPGDSSSKVELKQEAWTTRELATFNELDAQAQRHAERAERLGPAPCVSSRRRSKSKLSTRGSAPRRGGEGEDAEADAIAKWRGGCARSPRRSGAGTVKAILAFLRYWLAGWWFLPSQWRYGLPAAYVLPLGIRGDGGVRASILLMPEDETDESDQDLDAQEEREIAAEDQQEEERRSNLALIAAEPSDHLDVPTDAVASEEQQTGTNSSSDTDGLGDYPHHHHHHHHVVPPDPLLAAVGATRGGAESDRLSLSHHSLRRRSTDRSLVTRSSLSDVGATTLSPAGGGEGAMDFHTLVSDALWMVWSHWTTALVSGLLDILEDRLAQIEAEQQNEEDGEDGEGERLIRKVKEGLEVELGPADMASLGLSAGSALDVELVEALGARYLQLLTSAVCDSEVTPRVKVNRGWKVLRWLL